MVGRMKLTGRTGLMAIGLLVVVAAAGVLGFHVFTPTREPVGARCRRDPGPREALERSRRRLCRCSGKGAEVPRLLQLRSWPGTCDHGRQGGRAVRRAA